MLKNVSADPQTEDKHGEYFKEAAFHEDYGQSPDGEMDLHVEPHREVFGLDAGEVVQKWSATGDAFAGDEREFIGVQVDEVEKGLVVIGAGGVHQQPVQDG